MKAREIANINEHPGSADIMIFCPGCKCGHGIWTTKRNGNECIWEFNGNLEKPTVSPSLLVHGFNEITNKEYRCHSFIKDGKIQFLNDCSHELKGQTVDLPEF